MQATLPILPDVEISFNGHTGPLKIERNILFVESKRGFAVIRRYNSTPTFADIQATLLRKGII